MPDYNQVSNIESGLIGHLFTYRIIRAVVETRRRVLDRFKENARKTDEIISALLSGEEGVFFTFIRCILYCNIEITIHT